jgi:hypothetical protein
VEVINEEERAAFAGETARVSGVESALKIGEDLLGRGAEDKNV